MKATRNGSLKSLGVLALALCCGVLMTAASANEFGSHAPGVVAGLKKSFATRTAKTCEPTAPIETKLAFGSTPRIGQPVTVHFDVMTFEKGVNAEVRFDIEGASIDGPVLERGDFLPNRGYRFSRELVFDRPGQFEISAQAIAGIPEYRFGRRSKLYVEVSGSGIRYSQTPFTMADPDAPTPSPVFGGRAEARQIAPPRLGINIPQTEIPTIDPQGRPLDRNANGGNDVPTTVYGYWRYRHTNGTLQPGYGTAVEAWDEDTLSGDDFLGSVAAGFDGYFEIDFDNNSDGGGEPGTADVYLRFRTTNTEARVHNASDTIYSTQTAVLFPNITGGSHNAGSWYADWGTAGVSDANERAFQLQRDITTGWNEGIIFGHNAHQTFCEWYIGSVDGSYYVRGENRIYLEDSDVSSIDVVLHEYGHSYHDSFNGENDWPPGSGGPHNFTGHYTDGLALTEGYGTYFSCAAQDDDRWYDSYDPGNLIHFDCDANWDGNGSPNGNSDDLSNNPNWGYDTESAVLSFLLDIDDARNSPTDPYDWMTMGHDEIHDIFFNHMVSGHHLYSIRDFYAGWYARNHPVRPKINGQMMVHGMKQGADRPVLGLFSGISVYTGTWYFGGYGRANYTVKNYGSQTYNLVQLYVWVTDPDGTDIPGFGGDGNSNSLASGATREILKSHDQLGMTSGGTIIADPRYGDYRIRAGFYRTGNVWTLLDPAESGTDRDILRNVVQDTTAPTVTSQDDGDFQFSRTSMRVRGNATELQSSIHSFWVRIGTSPGGGDVVAWTQFLQNNNTVFDEVINFPQVPIGTTLYADVVARNIELLDGWSSTNGIQVVSPERSPISMTVVRGIVQSGNLASVLNSDDNRLNVRPGIVLSPTQDPIVLEFTGSAPVMPLTSITLKVESAASSGSIRMWVDMWDYVAGAWVTVGQPQMTTTDTLYQYTPANYQRFVNQSTGQMRTRIRYKPTAPVLTLPYTARLDWVRWTLNP